jgi:hypothetical protein
MPCEAMLLDARSTGNGRNCKSTLMALCEDPHDERTDVKQEKDQAAITRKDQGRERSPIDFDLPRNRINCHIAGQLNAAPR